MGKLHKFIVLGCLLMVANAWAVPFKDDFNRISGAVGNGWTILADGTVTSTITDNEVLVTGTEATDWARCGIERTVVGETTVSCDFKNDDSFNFHIRITLPDNLECGLHLVTSGYHFVLIRRRQ